MADLGLALIVMSIAGCVFGEYYVDANKMQKMTPQQICVSKALTQADRVECLKAKNG